MKYAIRHICISTIFVFIPITSFGEVIVREVMRLNTAQQEALISNAKLLAHEDVDVLEIRPFKPLRPFYPEPYAEIVLGPYELDENSFTLDIVTCTGSRGAFSWDCDLQSTRHFIYKESIFKSFEFAENVSKTIAIAIYDEALKSCNISFGSTYTYKPKVAASQNRDRLFLGNSNCNHEFSYNNGEATIGEKIQFLE